MLSITSKKPEGQKHLNTLPKPLTPVGSNAARTGETDGKQKGRLELTAAKGRRFRQKRGEKGKNCGPERWRGPGPPRLTCAVAGGHGERR